MKLLYRAFLDVFVKTHREFPLDFQYNSRYLRILFNNCHANVNQVTRGLDLLPPLGKRPKNLFYSLCTFQLFHKRKIISLILNDAFCLSNYCSSSIMTGISTFVYIQCVLSESCWLDGLKKPNFIARRIIFY